MKQLKGAKDAGRQRLFVMVGVGVALLVAALFLPKMLAGGGGAAAATAKAPAASATAGAGTRRTTTTVAGPPTTLGPPEAGRDPFKPPAPAGESNGASKPSK